MLNRSSQGIGSDHKRGERERERDEDNFPMLNRFSGGGSEGCNACRADTLGSVKDVSLSLSPGEHRRLAYGAAALPSVRSMSFKSVRSQKSSADNAGGKGI